MDTRTVSRDGVNVAPPGKVGSNSALLWDIALAMERESKELAADNEAGARGDSLDTTSRRDQSNKVANVEEAEEFTVVVFGSVRSGKTTIISRILERNDDNPKPTLALEYTFGRKARAQSLIKDIGHLWELGGGTFMTHLLEFAITSETLDRSAAVLVLDLSRLDDLWLTLESCLKGLTARTDKAAQEKPATYRALLREKAMDRYDKHPDKEMLTPSLVPFVILGSKYDIFQDFDSEEKKIVCKTLRFVSHTFGASLQFYTCKNENLLSKTKALVSHLLFRTPVNKSFETDYNKPLSVPVGRDSLQQIGMPPLKDGDLGHAGARTPMDLWKYAFCKQFPQKRSGAAEVPADPLEGSSYLEPCVDEMRHQKSAELKRYKSQVERKESLQLEDTEGQIGRVHHGVLYM